VIAWISGAAVAELQRRCPTSGAVTDIALLAGDEMPTVFASGGNVIVAARTAAGHRAVVKTGR